MKKKKLKKVLKKLYKTLANISENNISTYSFHDGNTKVETNYINIADILKAIDSIEKKIKNI